MKFSADSIFSLEALKWKIGTRGFTLQEVLIMAAMNLVTELIATDKGERTKWRSRAHRNSRGQGESMAKVIEFYMPNNFRKAFRAVAQPQLGKIIEFCPQTKRSSYLLSLFPFGCHHVHPPCVHTARRDLSGVL